jgi:hypothetical protein
MRGYGNAIHKKGLPFSEGLFIVVLIIKYGFRILLSSDWQNRSAFWHSPF